MPERRGGEPVDLALPLTPARAIAPAPTVFPFLTLTRWTIVIDALGWHI